MIMYESHTKFSNTLKTIVIPFLFFLTINTLAQEHPNQGFLDSAEVIQIAKWRNAYWSNGVFPKPILHLESAKQEWQVVSTKSKHTLKGHCRFTNGCTEITQLILIVDAQTGKVKSKTKQKKRYSNYE